MEKKKKNTVFPDGAQEQDQPQRSAGEIKRAYLFKLVAMIVIIGILLIYTTIAWFTMSKEVGMNGMSIGTAEMPFELAVPENGNIGSISYIQSGTKESATYDAGTAINDMENGAHAGDGELGTYTYITSVGTTSSGSFYATSGSSDTIKWRLTDPENVNGLGPNSSGKFVFYVIPKQTGELRIRVKLSIEGYKATVSRNENNTFEAKELEKIESDDPRFSAVTYLNSHMLFFKEWTGSQQGATAPYYYRAFLEGGELEITLTNCVVDRLVPVTIYWIWPNTYAQMTCIADTGNVANSSEGASDVDSSTVEALRRFVVERRSEILKSDTDLANLMASSSLVDEETVYTFASETAAENVEDLSLAYNLADQEIGTSIQYFLLTLSAQQ